MKTTPDALALLQNIAMLDRKLISLFEDNRSIFCAPNSPPEQRELRKQQSEYKKWRQSSVDMLLAELLRANA